MLNAAWTMHPSERGRECVYSWDHPNKHIIHKRLIKTKTKVAATTTCRDRDMNVQLALQVGIFPSPSLFLSLPHLDKMAKFTSIFKILDDNSIRQILLSLFV